ncbi:MAG: DUF6029 family protein [Dysgonamonadaceae bacterium]|jgi:hypothetical protein|nr:DUF6029 family protein [Dysgonamonadaceae bacterium]
MFRKILFTTVLFSLFLFTANAQIKIGENSVLTGSLQTDNLVEDKLMDNTYLDLNFTSNHIQAGMRLEYLQYPLPGYESEFKGYGLGNIFVTGKFKKLEVTVGSVYDQFGSGLIFRTYEEKSMGIDNSLMGGRIKFQPYKGVSLKALGGKQRRYFKFNEGYVLGGDVELNIEEWIKKLQENNVYWSWGGSFVSKNEKQEYRISEIIPDIIPDMPIDSFSVYRYNFPENVGAFDFRTHFQKDNVNVLLEYAIKSQDPSFNNNYTYKRGNASLMSVSYSKKGLTALIQAKRSENMSFRSKRSQDGISSFINHLPSFTTQQTYALAALYPYATQPMGEWAFQGDFSYTFKRKTVLGGKYGTLLRLNVSHIRAVDTCSYFKMGETLYYQDINLNIDKKISNRFKLNGMYMFQKYNPRVIVGHDEDLITSHIFVAEGKYTINNKLTLRSELQYLHASEYAGSEEVEPGDRSNQGDWVFGLVELSVAPSLMFAVQDNYNLGVTKEHYYMASVVYTKKSHRLQLGFGKTRAGFDCSGGVCRFVPATKGLRLSYNYQF